MDSKKGRFSGPTATAVVIVTLCILTVAVVIILAHREKNSPFREGASSEPYVVTYNPPDTEGRSGDVTSEQTESHSGTGTPSSDAATGTPGSADVSTGYSGTQTEPEASSQPIAATESEVTTEAALITTEGPVLTAGPPVETTAEPIITTQKPIVTTQKPIVTTQKPVVTTSPVTAARTAQEPGITAPETTSKPKETEPVIITPVETTAPLSPETTQAQNIVKPELKYGEEKDDVLIAPNGDMVEGYWIRDGQGTHFVVKEPEFEYGTTLRWWGYSVARDCLISGTYYYKNSILIVFEADEHYYSTIFVDEPTGIIHTEQEYTAPPGTWW